MRVVGVDGFSRGWVAVLSDGGAFAGAETFPSIGPLVQWSGDAVVIGIDIPIGLPDAGVRAADSLARRRVGGARSSSVFPCPPRVVLEAPDYTTARRIAQDTWGRGVSAQSYALRHRTLEVDALLGDDARLFEVHPEVSFRAMAGAPMRFAKKTWNGQMERRAALAGTGMELPDALPDQVGRVPPDDLLDAAAVAWSAARIAAGSARSLPDPPERNTEGRAMAIWY